VKKNRKNIVKPKKKNFLRQKAREKKLSDLNIGFEKYKADVRKNNPKEDFKGIALYQFIQKSYLGSRPEYSELIEYLFKKEDAFGKKNIEFKDNTFEVPEPFSLIENYKESSLFLKKLFNALYYESFNHIFIDYSKCNCIDVGASMCMDIILADFINYFDKSEKSKHSVKIDGITPINYDKHNIKKVLFSIGAFRSIKGFKIDYDNIIDFPIIIGSKRDIDLPAQREIDITNTVDYIIQCLSKLNKKLSGLAETNFYKVIGEVIQNADEHSDTTKRYSIGYFEKTDIENHTYGIFNLAILNFGNTIYETFKNPNCENIDVVRQMKELSEKFTSKNFFLQSEFEEETLWTLYALQDGVTRMPLWDRGNGAIRFIESFFKLKGENGNDEISKMVITSGHTRIIFDGKYEIVSKPRGINNKMYKMMTFNESENIEDKPDPKYVKYEKNYFPGTLISVKIRIDFENTENI
jgi:hypothetical protein